MLKNSGAIKSNVHQAAEILEISVYTLPKLTGTRFVFHSRQAFTCLLDMWPAIVIALENTLTACKHKPDTRAKISGLVTQLHSYKCICLTCCYLDILEKITPVSMLFEENSSSPGECSSIIRQASIELEDMYECIGTEEEMIDSHLSRFILTEDEDGQQILKSQFSKHSHMLH